MDEITRMAREDFGFLQVLGRPYRTSEFGVEYQTYRGAQPIEDGAGTVPAEDIGVICDRWRAILEHERRSNGRVAVVWRTMPELQHEGGDLFWARWRCHFLSAKDLLDEHGNPRFNPIISEAKEAA